MKKYDSYKDSGVEWIGEIPSEWTKNKFNRLIKFQEGPGLRTFQFTETGTKVICVTNITENGIDFSKFKKFISIEEYKEKYTHFTVKNGDYLLSSSGNSWGKVSEYKENEEVILNTSTIRLNTKNDKKFNKRLIPYILNSNSIKIQLEILMTGSCQPNFGPTHLDKLEIVYPPLPEQQQIVQFLDKKTYLIDSLIEKTQRKIELLKEKRTSLINHIVTKGLNPNVKMRDSGVEWIGEIPVNWGKVKIKFLGRVSSGDSLESSFIDKEEGKYPVYGGNGIMGYYSNFNFNKPILVIGRVGEKCGNVHYSDGDIYVNDNSLVYEQYDGRMDLWYVYHSLIQRNLNQLRNKNTQPLITGTIVKDEFIPFPPKNEQQQIVEYLDEQTSIIDTTITKEQKRIELLKEYRQSLISEVVTGKIKVCN